MDYEALAHRVEPFITEAFAEWADVAQRWALGDEGSIREITLWNHCMKTSGSALRSYE